MVRVLEFRAWDGKKMIDDVIPASETSIIELFEYEWQEVDVEAVEQYTGLKDKNGQKIYEGDIVKYDDGDAYGVCSFNGCFGIKNRNLSVLYSSYTFNDNDLYSSTGKLRLEVIGNIHENPELLEVKNVD